VPRMHEPLEDRGTLRFAPATQRLIDRRTMQRKPL
jgi:hypothetical protein